MADEAVIYTEIRRVDPGLIQALRRCGVATIVEAMGPTIGPRQTMAPRIARRTTTSRIGGQAITAANRLGDNLMTHAALRVAREGDVLAISCGSSPGAQWGELTSQAAAARGLVGVIIDGAARDIDEIEELGFPVWAASVSPVGADKVALGTVNEPIACGGVSVNPGDIIVADGDGAVVVPLKMASLVVEAAERRVEKEKASRAAAQRGELPGELSGIYRYLDSSGVRIVEGVWPDGD